MKKKYSQRDHQTQLLPINYRASRYLYSKLKKHRLLLKLTTLFKVPFLNKVAQRISLMHEREKWLETLASKHASFVRPLFKTNHASYTHTHSFIVEKTKQQDVVWSVQHDQEQWRPIFIRSLVNQRIACISADGANLCIQDQTGVIYYKKIIIEKRDGEEYHWCDIIDDPLDEGRWYKFPWLHYVLRFFMPEQLKLSFTPWSISHRGLYKDYYSDCLQQQHHGFWITQLYQLSANGLFIRIYDPYLPPYVKILLDLPQRKNLNFHAVQLSASASTIAVLGYKTTALASGVKKQLTLFTRLFCLDSAGYNPYLRYSFNREKGKRLLPVDNWLEHPLPICNSLSHHITISQTGPGNHSFQLMVEGVDDKKENYIFYKTIDEPEWHKLPQKPIKESFLYPLEVNFTATSFQSIAQHWQGVSRLDRNLTLTLIDYYPGKQCTQAVLSGKLEKRCLLYVRKKLIHETFGFKTQQIELVVDGVAWSVTKLRFSEKAVDISLKIAGKSHRFILEVMAENPLGYSEFSNVGGISDFGKKSNASEFMQ